MRFRARLVDIGCIQHLTRILNTISRMAKICALRLTPEKLYFILADSAGSGGVNIWCELTQCNFFDEYRIEGKDENNNIYLELHPDNLARAMKSAQNAQAVKIKLTKKQNACLTFDISLPSMTSHSRQVVHDIPVSVIPQKNWDEYQEPNMPDFDVSIYMPSIKVVKNVAERMKNLSNHLVISANYNGYMTLRVDTDEVSVTTHFRELDNPSWRNEDMPDNEKKDVEEMFEARVDVRKFVTFLNSQQVSPERVICNIVDGKAVQLFLLHEEFSLQYFIPAIVK